MRKFEEGSFVDFVTLGYIYKEVNTKNNFEWIWECITQKDRKAFVLIGTNGATDSILGETNVIFDGLEFKDRNVYELGPITDFPEYFL